MSEQPEASSVTYRRSSSPTVKTERHPKHHLETSECSPKENRNSCEAEGGDGVSQKHASETGLCRLPNPKSLSSLACPAFSPKSQHVSCFGRCCRNLSSSE